jgi:hypothetical protein
MSQPVSIGILDEIRETLQRVVREQLDDLRYIEITTAVSDNINAKINPQYENLVLALTAESGVPLPLKPKAGAEEEEQQVQRKKEDELKADVLARTRIELDGDIALILPTNRSEIDMEVLQIHKANVDVAVQNWRYFIDAMLDVLKIVATLTQR